MTEAGGEASSGEHPRLGSPVESIEAAMDLAIAASEVVRGSTYPNPPVGAVVIDADGILRGVGATSPPGGPHAEIHALRQAGDRARGGTIVVTLEPCNHTGRTGPCSHAVAAAGIVRVVHAVSDPNPTAAGGAHYLRERGIEVVSGVGADRVASGPLEAWLHRVRTGRPLVTWKYAATLDGRIAAIDGTSRWITGPAARRRVHDRRAHLGAIVVGTGTVLADDPHLTARLPDDSLAAHQPTRVVVGRRELPPTARILDDGAPTLLLREHDPAAVIAQLADRVDVQIEGGAVLAGAFLAAGAVDRIEAYIAPVVLGDGLPAVVGAGVDTIAHVHRFRPRTVESLGPDTLITFDREPAGIGFRQD